MKKKAEPRKRSPASRRPKRRRWNWDDVRGFLMRFHVPLVLGILVLGNYARSLHYPYHFDDNHSIQHNLALRDLSTIPQFWTDPTLSTTVATNRNFRPLYYTVQSLAWNVGGGATWPFHVLKLIFLFASGMLVFLVWKKLWSLPGWRLPEGMEMSLGPFGKVPLGAHQVALLLGGLFVIHPAVNECAVYLSASTHLRSMVCYLAAFYLYLTWRGQPLWTPRFWGALGMYFCAFMTKEEGITFPAVVVLTELILGRQKTWVARFKEAGIRVAPFVVLAGLMLFWWKGVFPKTAHFGGGTWENRWEYFITQWRAWIWYMKVWFWPFGLNADNVEFGFNKSFFESSVIQAFLLNLGILAFAFYHRRHQPALWFGMLWFYIVISPASSVMPLTEPVNEHRQLGAYFGFIGGTLGFILWFIHKWMPKKERSLFLTPAVAVVAIALMIGTQERNRVWSDPANLWADTVEKNPSSGRAKNNLALVRLGEGDLQGAYKLIQGCLKTWPEYIYCWLNKGNMLKRMKKVDESEKAYRKAVSLYPHRAIVYCQLGEFLEYYRKDDAKALGQYAKCEELSHGKKTESLFGQARILERMGKKDLALTKMQEVLKFDPNHKGALKESRRLASTP